jgi:hypothetical protein
MMSSQSLFSTAVGFIGTPAAAVENEFECVAVPATAGFLSDKSLDADPEAHDYEEAGHGIQ